MQAAVFGRFSGPNRYKIARCVSMHSYGIVEAVDVAPLVCVARARSVIVRLPAFRTGGDHGRRFPRRMPVVEGHKRAVRQVGRATTNGATRWRTGDSYRIWGRVYIFEWAFWVRRHCFVGAPCAGIVRGLAPTRMRMPHTLHALRMHGLNAFVSVCVCVCERVCV